MKRENPGVYIREPKGENYMPAVNITMGTLNYVVGKEKEVLVDY